MTIKSPLDISDLLLWFDASKIDLNDGDQVLQWDDARGNVMSLLPPSGKAPIFLKNGLNNKPAVLFNGTQELLGTYTMSSQDSTIFIVFESVATSLNQCLYGSVGHRLYHVINTAGNTGIWNAGTTSALGKSMMTGRPQLGTWAWKYNTKIDYYRNQGLVGSQNLALNGAGTYKDFAIGSNKESSHYFNGKISEIIIFARRMTDLEKSNVEEYLHNKWMNDVGTIVQFKNYKNMSISNESTKFTKLTGMPKDTQTSWDAEAEALPQYWLYEGQDAYYEFSIPPTLLDSGGLFQVSIQNTYTNSANLLYSWYFAKNTAMAFISGGGSYSHSGNVSSSTKLGLGIENGQITFYLDGKKVLQDSNIPTYPLKLYGLTMELNHYMENIFLKRSPRMNYETKLLPWTGLNNTTIGSNNEIIKTSGGSAWNAGGVSQIEVKGDTSIEWINSSTGQYALGLSKVSTKEHPLDHQIRISGTTWYINEGTATDIKSGTGVAIGDVFRIILTTLGANGIISYYKNDTLLYSSIVNPTIPYYVDTSIYTQGATIEGAKITTITPYKEGEVSLNGESSLSAKASGIYSSLTNMDSVSSLNIVADKLIYGKLQTSINSNISVNTTKTTLGSVEMNSDSTSSIKPTNVKYATSNSIIKSKMTASHGFAVLEGTSELNMKATKQRYSKVNLKGQSNLSSKAITVKHSDSTQNTNLTMVTSGDVLKTGKINTNVKSTSNMKAIVQANAHINIYNKSNLSLENRPKYLTDYGSIIGNKPQKLRLQVALPNGRVMGNLPEASTTANQIINLGKLNELTFKIPYLVDRHNEQVRNPNVDRLKERFLIKATLGKKVEWYIINEIKDVMDQNGDSKEIHAFSLGYELRDKLLRSYKVDPKNLREVISEVLSSTIWSLGYVDSEFEIKYRSFDVSEQTLLDFIYEVAETFNAIVEFDTVKRQLHFKRTESVGQNPNPLRLSFRKYLKSLNKTSIPDDLVTRLLVFGKEGISIQKINPTGSNYIESFEYFLYPFQRDENRNVIRHSDYMEDELCHAILDYQELVKGKQGQFKILLEQMESKQAQLVLAQNELTNLEIELAIIEDRLEVAKSTGASTTTIEAEKATKQIEIDAKKLVVDGLNSELNLINNQIKQLQDEIALEKVFSPRLLKERNKYIIEATWENEYISDEKELYDEAVKQFENLKKPKLLMELDIVNFLEVLEEKRNWDKLNIGDDIYVHYEQLRVDVLAKIIEINYDHSNQSIKLTIANVQEIENDEEKFIKQLYSSISTSKKVDMSEYKWNNTADKLGEINEIIEGQWDANKRMITAGVNNSVTISKRGITIENSENPNNVLIIQNGIMAISNDRTQTWKHAITADGIVGERIFGKLIAGVNLAIQNDSGKFTFDSNGVEIDGAALTIKNGGLRKENLDPSFADELVVRGQVYNGIRIDTTSGLTVTRSDDRVKAIFNATDGLKFQVKEGTVWKDKLYYDVDTSNLVIEGEINARQLKVRGKNVLTIDDKIDGQHISKISTDQLIAGTAKISTAMIESLEVGRNVVLGNNAYISWNQVYNQPTAEQIGGVSSTSPRLTYIDAYGLYTGTISADKIQGGTMQGIDWMSNSRTTPFMVYIGSKADKAMEIYYDSINMWRQGTRYFRVDPTGIYHNGVPFSSVATFG